MFELIATTTKIFRMRWLKKGFCGTSLKKHTYFVVSFDMALSIGAMLLGFVVIVYPEKYISMPDSVDDDFSRAAEEMVEMFVNETNTEISAAANNSEVIEEIKNGNISSHERFHYRERLKDAQDEGVEVIITAMVTIVTTILLVVGVRKSKSLYFIPWLAENVTAISIAVGVALIRLLSGTARSITGTIIGLLIFIPLYSYLVFGVASYFVMIRRMKKHSTQIISSVMQGDGSYQDGIKFDQLPTVDEIGKEMQAFPANTATRINDGADRRDDVLYFSI